MKRSLFLALILAGSLCVPMQETKAIEGPRLVGSLFAGYVAACLVPAAIALCKCGSCTDNDIAQIERENCEKVVLTGLGALVLTTALVYNYKHVLKLIKPCSASSSVQ